MKQENKTLMLAAVVTILILVSASTAYYFYPDGDKEDGYVDTVVLAPGETAYYQVRGNGDVTPMPRPLPPFPGEVKSALGRVPGWLRPDLEEKFTELSRMEMSVWARATPSFADFDLDGDYDLVTGNENGEVQFKRNEGSPYYPIFTPTDLTEGIAGDENVAPVMADLNGDGNTDLIMGSHNDVLDFYRNDGDNEQPVWTKDNGIFDGVNVVGSIFPRLVDYDGDEDFDLIVVEHSGSVTTMRFFENSGTTEQPSWSERIGMFALLQSVVTNYPFPAMADLDNDGDLDLTMGGRDGRLRYFENRGSLYATLWTENDIIYSDINTGTRATPAFADLNGDSRIDLVVGEENGTFFRFYNRGTSELPSFIALNSGSIYYDTSAAGSIGEVLEEARGTLLGPSTINVDRMLKEYYDDDIIAYADLINEAPRKCVDELGFIIAHTNADVLRAMSGTIDLGDPECTYDPGILLDHVEEHYRLNGELRYAGIREKDDYTTLWYITGEGEEKELPRDDYYWYVVHPRCRYEAPGYTHGDYWREYLRYDEQYANEFGANLVDAVKDAENIHDAVYALTRWMDAFMDFGYDSHDKTPIEIYDLHYGSCGEWSIITNALGRAVFIPTRLGNDWAEDHVWNEFYDDVENGTWHHWDTTGPNIDDPESYERDWGKDISAVFSYRGDDLVYEYGVTEKYTDTAHITVRVRDRNGDPVDGACVVMQSEYFVRNNPAYMPAPMISIWNYTDESGECEFDLGNNYYTIDVMSEIGTYHRGYPNLLAGTPGGSYRVVEGQDDTIAITIDGEMPERPAMGDQQIAKKGDVSVKIELMDVNVVAQSIVSYPDDTVVITGNRYPQPVEGTIEVFVCDQNNFERYMAGLDFDYTESVMVSRGTPEEFTLPGGDWYVVLCNRYCLGTERVVEISIE